MLKRWEGLWLTFMCPQRLSPETQFHCLHDFGLVAGESAVRGVDQGPHGNKKGGGTTEITPTPSSLFQALCLCVVISDTWLSHEVGFMALLYISQRDGMPCANLHGLCLGHLHY